MITQEMWQAMTPQDRITRLSEALQLLQSIRNCTHELYGKPEQGRLRPLRTANEQFVLNVLQWEAPNNSTGNNT